jgi:hypothetical protein
MPIQWKAPNGDKVHNFYGTMEEFKEIFPFAVVVKPRPTRRKKC